MLDGGQAVAALDKSERIILSAAAVLFTIYFHQPVFLLVAAGAAYRAFGKNIPAAPSHSVTAYYLLVLASLGFIIQLAPPVAHPCALAPARDALHLAGAAGRQARRCEVCAGTSSGAAPT